MSLKIIGIGDALPEQRVTNHDLAKMMETSDEWIRTRTGIVERRLCGDDENTLTMGVRAAKAALADAGVDARDLTMIILSSVAPYEIVPPLACQILREIGAACPAFDLNAACSGFLYSLSIADAMSCGPVLLVCSEQTSSYVDFSDRRTCVLFGDGAGAAVVAPGDGMSYIDIRGAADSLRALVAHGINRRSEDGGFIPSYLEMDGQEVYKFATREMIDLIGTALRATGLGHEDIRYIIPHQANLRIIKSCSERLGIPWEKFFVNIDRLGNTSSAAIPLALSELRRSGLLTEGDRVLLAAFGAGWTAGAAILTL